MLNWTEHLNFGFEVCMYWDVKVVKPLPNYKIYVEIEDGQKGIFDVSPYLENRCL